MTAGRPVASWDNKCRDRRSEISVLKLRRRSFGALAAGALSGLAATTIALPVAAAQPQCTAAGLSSAVGSVASATGQYFDSHPDANQMMTSVGTTQPRPHNQSKWA